MKDKFVLYITLQSFDIKLTVKIGDGKSAAKGILTGGFRFVVTLSMATLKKLCSMNLSQSDLY